MIHRIKILNVPYKASQLPRVNILTANIDLRVFWKRNKRDCQRLHLFELEYAKEEVPVIFRHALGSYISPTGLVYLILPKSINIIPIDSSFNSTYY